MHNPEPNSLDHNIDRALASYVDVEPAPSLEYRVLENIHQAAHRKSRLWWWAIASPLLATTLLIVLLYPTAKVGAPSLPGKSETSESPTAKMSVPSLPNNDLPGAPSLRSKGGKSENIASLRSKVRLTAIAPKPEITSDLTLHDAALVALVRESPNELRALFARTDPAPIAPLAIDEIEIKPITTDAIR